MIAWRLACWLHALVLLSVFVSSLSKPKAALEATFKERIEVKLTKSLQAVAVHLGSRRGGGDAFGNYELELNKTASKRWRHECTEVVPGRDSIELCAMRQLHAMGALCDASTLVEVDSKAAKRQLKSLAAKAVPSLALKRSTFDGGIDIWFHRKKADADDVDGSPALQASALMAMACCAHATKQTEYFKEAETWFAGLQKVYPQTLWQKAPLSFHKKAIIWESLSLVAVHLPLGSSFQTALQGYLADLEAYLWKLWTDESEEWSFASARAIALRLKSPALKKQKQRKLLRKWAQEHVDRLLGDKSTGPGILAKLGGEGYSCGPLQGLTSLASVLTDNVELLQVVLQLLEKDVDKYQVVDKSQSPMASLEVADSAVVGAFFRDGLQLTMEQRDTWRIDDSTQCAIALTQALQHLSNVQGVSVEPPGEEAGDVATTDTGRDSDL